MKKKIVSILKNMVIIVRMIIIIILTIVIIIIITINTSFDILFGIHDDNIINNLIISILLLLLLYIYICVYVYCCSFFNILLIIYMNMLLL